MPEFLTIALTISGILSPVFGILGIYLGFRLSESSVHSRDEKAEIVQKARIRTLLKLEIAQNLATLQKYWEKVNDVNASDEGGRKLKVWFRLVQFPVRWNHGVWESQLSALPIALSEGEIRQVYNFHCNLDALTDIRAHLSEMKRDGESNSDVYQWADKITKMGELLEEYKKIVETLEQTAPSLLINGVKVKEEARKQLEALKQEQEGKVG